MDYRVRVMPSGPNGLPEGYIVKSMTAGSVDLLTQPIRITAAMPMEIAVTFGIAAKPPWVRVRGRITGVDAMHAAPTSVVFQGPLSDGLSVPVLPDGTFEIPMVLPGTYQARLTPNVDPFPRTIVVQREDPASIEIPLRVPSFKVSGRTSEVAPPNKFLRATLFPEQPGSGNLPGSSPVAADGSFVFPAVQPGTYRATIAICESDVCGSTGGSVITVDKDIDGLLVTRDNPFPAPANRVPQGPAPVATNVVEGTITLENGVLMPRFRLRFTGNSVTRTVGVDAKSFTITLPPGDHRVAVADLPEGYEVRSIVDGTSDLRFWPLSVATTAVPQRVAITLRVKSPAPWVKVGGRVLGISGGTAVTVELTGKILADALKAPVGPDGSFAFPTVLPDTYTLRLLPLGNASGQTITVGAAGLAGVEIDAANHR
jgi:hypothetical protein